MTQAEDKRRQRRIPIDLWIEAEREGELYFQRATNLSIGGAYFTLLSTTNFNKNMTSGLGFVALAALIFGRWSPIGSMLASLFFGFTSALAFSLGSIGSSIPSQFLNMLPYVATIVAVAGLVGRVRAPAPDGKPYIKG